MLAGENPRLLTLPPSVVKNGEASLSWIIDID